MAVEVSLDNTRSLLLALKPLLSTMLRLLCTIACHATLVVAFSSHSLPSRAGAQLTVMNAKSTSIPFLSRPEKLDGTMVGDYGFDPMGLTDNLNTLNFVRAAELKHCRVAMLASLGFLVQQKIHFLSPEPDPLKAMVSLGLGPNMQIFSFIAVIELMTWEKTYSETSTPGDLGFDPLNYAAKSSPKAMQVLQLKELKNGRLAMVGIIGMLCQHLATGGKPIW